MRPIPIGGPALPTFRVGLPMLKGLLLAFDGLPPITCTPCFRGPLANLSQLVPPAMVAGCRFAAVLARLIRSSPTEILA